MTKIINARVLCENGFEQRDVYFNNGKISFEGNGADCVVDAAGKMLLPGFIDIHIHGVRGCDFNDGDVDGLDTIAEFCASHGTTGLLATTSTAHIEALRKAVVAISTKMETGTVGAGILGLHMEGPFFSTMALGAQNPEYVLDMTVKNLDYILGDNAHILRMAALSPEATGAFEMIEELKRRGVVCAIGHTGADYDTASKALEKGANMLTHFYNAMTPLKHRDPGVVGAVFERGDADIQLICDFIHVHPAALKVAIKNVKRENVIMISDAISGTGLGDGQYMLGGLEIFVKDGIARIAEGNLAGSTLTLDVAMKNMVSIGYSVEEVSRFLSANPARAIGYGSTKGVIGEGYDADVILMTDDFEVTDTFVGGKCVYSK